MPLVIALIVGAILGAATFYFGGQFLPSPDMVYLRGEGDMANVMVNQLMAASVLAGLLGWSLGLFFGARRG